MELFTPVFNWIILGLLFMAAELFFPCFFFSLTLSLSSLTAGIGAYLNFAPQGCFIAFVVVTPVWFLLLKQINKGYNKHITYKSSVEELFSHELTILKNHATQGVPKIMYQGVLWSVKEKDNKELHHNDRVKALYIKGNSFIVTKIT